MVATILVRFADQYPWKQKAAMLLDFALFAIQLKLLSHATAWFAY